MDPPKPRRPLLVINGKSYKEQFALGKGGFAKVYKAINVDTLQEVAIKKILREKINNKGLMRKVNEEIMNHRSLKHESILAIYDFHEDSRYIYLVLELCSKGDLVTYLQRHNRKRISEPEACTIAKQVLDGLLHLHSSGILHRDLKLANILVTEKNRIKIADFGLSTKLNGATDVHKTMCGTPNFMSPEVAAQAPHGSGVDMWGLGAVLFTLICGEPPFKTHSISSILEKVRSETLKIPDFVSPEARDILSLLLEKNPHYRITAEQATNHAFFRKYPDTPLKCNVNDSGLGVSCVACADCHRSTLTDNTMSSSRFTSSCTSLYKSQENLHRNGSVTSHKSNYGLAGGITSSNHGHQDTSSLTQRPKTIRSQTFKPLTNSCNSRETPLSKESDLQSCLTESQNGLRNNSNQSIRNSTFADRTPPQKDAIIFYDLSPIPSNSTSPSVHSKNISSGFGDVPSQHSLSGTPSDRRLSFISTKRLGRVCLKAEKGLCYIKGRGEVVLEMPLKGTVLNRYYVITQDHYMTSYAAAEYVWPPPESSVRHHCTSLPSKWLKKYSLLERVVSKIRSRTVKITLHSEVATCKLMESSPDHFVVDLRTGERIRKEGENVILDRPDRASSTYKFNKLRLECADAQIANVFLSLFEKCLKLEKDLDEDLFPISCGRRALAL